MKEFFRSITAFEYCLWGGGILAIVLSFFLCHNTDYLNLAGSIWGCSCLILLAKGNVVGQIMSVIFSAYYGYVSFTTKYYGEMITYIGMTAPIAIAAVVSWFRHPFQGKKTEVEVATPSLKKYLIVFCLSVPVTIAFFFILHALGTANVAWSAVSVLTSFVAVSLSLLRSPYYAAAYACNDIVLIILWSLAAAADREYISLVVCFAVFLAEDCYGLINWLKLRKRQKKERAHPFTASEGGTPSGNDS